MTLDYSFQPAPVHCTRCGRAVTDIPEDRRCPFCHAPLSSPVMPRLNQLPPRYLYTIGTGAAIRIGVLIWWMIGALAPFAPLHSAIDTFFTNFGDALALGVLTLDLVACILVAWRAPGRLISPLLRHVLHAAAIAAVLIAAVPVLGALSSSGPPRIAQPWLLLWGNVAEMVRAIAFFLILRQVMLWGNARYLAAQLAWLMIAYLVILQMYNVAYIFSSYLVPLALTIEFEPIYYLTCVLEAPLDIWAVLVLGWIIFRCNQSAAEGINLFNPASADTPPSR